jgi:hypothetical protein
MEAAAPIDPSGDPENTGVLIQRKSAILDSVQSVLTGSLELLERRLFPFASGHGLEYLMAQHQRR